MSASNFFETAALNLIFLNAAIANIGDATGLRGSTASGSLYISLHTADPGEAGSQSTSETSYTNYGRIGVVRTSSGWTVSGNAATNAAIITFAQCGTTGATLTHFGIGTDSSGAGTLLFSGALSPNLSVSNGITPSIAIGQLSTAAD